MSLVLCLLMSLFALPVFAQSADPVAGSVADSGTDADSEAETGSGTEAPKADTPSFDIQVGYRPSDIFLGQLLSVELRLQTPTGADVAIDEHEFDGFELHHKERHSEVNAAGQRDWILRLDLLALAVEESDVGKIPVRILLKDGQIVRQQTAAHPIKIRSVVGNEPDAKPAPPTEPHSIMEPDPRPRYAITALLLIAFGGLLAWLLLKFLRREKPEVVEPPEAAWIVAKRELRRLRQNRGTQFRGGQSVAWIDSLNDIVRTYVGRRLEFDGLESTTDEIRQHLRKRNLRGVQGPKLILFLEECDLIKFAKADIDAERGEEMLRDAESFVRASTPTGTDSEADSAADSAADSEADSDERGQK